MFQCSSASRKFLNRGWRSPSARHFTVSVLFSEPKIPQYSMKCRNESSTDVSVLFSEPKIPQFDSASRTWRAEYVSVLFSEPKIPQCVSAACADLGVARFQCSSASRKFLNADICSSDCDVPARFSALQRAENSSIDLNDHLCWYVVGFSALQRAENSSIHQIRIDALDAFIRFQCSSASRKFLNIKKSAGLWYN